MFPEQDIGAAENSDITPAGAVIKASPAPSNPRVAVQDGNLPRVRVSLLILFM